MFSVLQENPEFAPKLHTILLESGASPPSDLFSNMNSRDRGLDTVQADSNRLLLLSYDKSLILPQGVGSSSNTRLCQSADQLAEQPKEFRTDANEFYDSSQISSSRNPFATVSGKDGDIQQSNPLIVDFVSLNTCNTCKEKCPESSLSKAVFSCKRHNGVECFCDNNESGPRNEAGASLNNIELGTDSVIQINETVDGDCILHDDGKSKQINSYNLQNNSTPHTQKQTATVTNMSENSVQSLFHNFEKVANFVQHHVSNFIGHHIQSSGTSGIGSVNASIKAPSANCSA